MRLSFISLLFLLFSCGNKSVSNNYIRAHYCIVNDSYNRMDVHFYMKSDSVFVYYLNVVDSGNYINGDVDSTNYAGYFKLEQIRDSNVTVVIKSYRNEDDQYGVNLQFSNNGKSLSWSIDSLVVAYLPKRAEFESCR